jgi:putative transposase
MEVKETEELRSLREQNHRLKKLVADLSLDKDILKSVISKNGVKLACLRARNAK